MGLYTGKVALTNGRSTPFALSNEFEDTWELEEAVALCNNTDELVDTVNQYVLYRPFSFADDNPRYTRLKNKDSWGNVHYFVAWKNDTVSALSKFSDLDLIEELEKRGYQIT